MTDTKAIKIERHGLNLLAIFPHTQVTDPARLYRAVRELEQRAKRLAVHGCNFGWTNKEDEEAGYRFILEDLNRLLGNIEPPAGMSTLRTIVPVFISRDPRGCQLKINDQWVREHRAVLHTDLGGYGIIAPELK